jgi:hypothetical protein
MLEPYPSGGFPRAGFGRPQRQSHYGLQVGIASEASASCSSPTRRAGFPEPGLDGRSGKATTASRSASQATPWSHAETMKTVVPMRTCRNNHSASWIRIRMQPWEAE